MCCGNGAEEPQWLASCWQRNRTRGARCWCDGPVDQLGCCCCCFNHTVKLASSGRTNGTPHAQLCVRSNDLTQPWRFGRRGGGRERGGRRAAAKSALPVCAISRLCHPAHGVCPLRGGRGSRGQRLTRITSALTAAGARRARRREQRPSFYMRASQQRNPTQARGALSRGRERFPRPLHTAPQHGRALGCAR